MIFARTRTVDGKTKVEATGSLGKSEDIQAKIREKDWNDYVVIAMGNHLQHFINGVQTVDVIDERTGGKAAKEGILALQLHAGDPMTVQFKDIRIKDLNKATVSFERVPNPAKIDPFISPTLPAK